MRSKFALAGAVVASAALVSAASASDVYTQGFETDTAGWFDSGNGWSGGVQRVLSGTGGIASASGTHHAIFTQSNGSGGLSAGFTRFDGYRSSWTGGYTASVDVYLDTGMASGEGFDYSVAATNSSTNGHLRDFIFHVAKDISTGQLLVGGSNNTNFDPRQDLDTLSNFYAVTASGWYTLEHVFRDAGDGTLAVDLNLRDALGTVVFTETRNDGSDVIGVNVGGNRYGWFTNIDVANGIHVDNVNLNVVPLPPAALAGLGLLGTLDGVRAARRR
jgi:hypothetical protein